MRQAINENRTVQLVLVGVLALAVSFMLLRGKGGGGESSAAQPSATAGTTAASTDPATSAPTGAAAATTGTATGAATTAPGAPAGTGAPAVPPNLVPGPGLPKGLLPAYHHGDAIVLLIRRAGGIDDSLVRDSVEGLRAEPRVKVYVTRARQIARYAWLAQGVDVSELPALVVLRPRRLTHGTPTASVSYGFRGSKSVVQAVRDALYHGPTDRPYHP